MGKYDDYIAKGQIPDFVLRWYVRRLCRQRIAAEPRNTEQRMRQLMDFVEDLRSQPLAIEVGAANLQHYEVPTEFFRIVLGKRFKYSSCHFPENIPVSQAQHHLDAAEEAMLKLTCERAGLSAGQEVLELGCGWGSLSLYMAEHFPETRITAISNSSTQKTYIDSVAKEKGFSNLTIITADINQFEPGKEFDRVVSVEMFEHMRNYGILFGRIENWLKKGGKLFFHIFTYEGTPYDYDANDPEDWMAQNFFAGGTMPSPELPFFFTGNFRTEKVWRVNGSHYQKTLEAWLQKMDANKAKLMPFFEREYKGEALKFWHHWRLFFLSCAEVFGYDEGNQWFVSHYLLERG